MLHPAQLLAHGGAGGGFKQTLVDSGVGDVIAAGTMAPLAAGLEPTQAALLVLAIGAGSVFLSHVNDAGFWLVKEYFGMTVGQTFKTWSLMESVLSVVALVVVLVLGAFVQPLARSRRTPQATDPNERERHSRTARRKVYPAEGVTNR